nr:postacrosomal sheath WW domain-binding protein [Manis javanica]
MVLDGKPGAGVLSEEGGGRRVELAARRLSATQGLSRLFLVRHAWGSGLPASGIRRWRRRERLASWVASEGRWERAGAGARGIPFVSVNYWFSARGPYVVTGQGNMMCTQQMPCPGYPVVVCGPLSAGHGAPPAGYGAPPLGYGAQSVGYGALPVGYRAPPAAYEAPPAGYGAPPAAYGAPPAGYGAPPAGYRAPPAAYGAPPAGYGAPPVGYGVLPAEDEALPAGNEALPAGYGALPLGHETLPAENRAGTQKSVAAQPSRCETSLPLTSSSKSCLPSSE